MGTTGGGVRRRRTVLVVQGEFPLDFLADALHGGVVREEGLEWRSRWDEVGDCTEYSVCN